MTAPTYDLGGTAAAIVLIGGPAQWDSGHHWQYGRIVGGLAPDTEPPAVWVFIAWIPWRGDFQPYLYAYAGPEHDWIAYRYAGPARHYDPRQALEETP